VISGDGEAGRTVEGCVGCMVGRLLVSVVMELLTGCAVEGGTVGDVNGGD